MKVGDLVKWKGFGQNNSNSNEYGIIVYIHSAYNLNEKYRYDVMWGCNKIGKGLYEETIILINEGTKT
jgi:hypothetical protein